MGSAVIFSGTKVKTLKSAIDLNGGNDIISSTTDPTASAVSANIGSLLLNSSSGKLYRKNDSGSSTNWTEVGASGQAGINYISNPNAATNTTGWATYADAAGAQPVDGTGGSANVTWTRSTTTPLRGAADFQFAKDAANRQGQGVSTDFTIDNADIAKVLTVTFDYEIVSGTYAVGDLTVYLIADPSGTPVIIQPAGYQIQAATSGTTMRQIATFQTQASGTSYRLCLHVASTSASAYTLAIDNVVVGPQVVQYGAPVTDWVSYTPTGAWTANVTYAGKWRRVGDTMEVVGRASTSGATTAANFTISIPSGFTIDTNKLAVSPSIIILGNADALAASNHYHCSVTYSTTTTVNVLTMNAAAAANHNITYLTNAIPGTFGSGDYVDVKFAVPITGWSSTVVMSNDTATNVISSRATLSAASSNFTSGVLAKIPLNQASNDGTGIFDSVNQYFRVSVPGDYLLSAVINWSTSTGLKLTSYRINGGTDNYISSIGSGDRICGSALLAGLKSGDYIELYGRQDSGGTAVVNSSVSNTQVSVFRLSGPSAIAASETVAMLYKTAAGASISNNSATAITFGTKVFDTHNSYSGSTYTVPVSGKYLVKMAIYTAATASAITDVQILAYKNGSVYQGANFPKGGTSTTPGGGNLAVTVQCNAGDTLQGYFLQNSGGSLTLLANDTFNWLSIERVGN